MKSFYASILILAVIANTSCGKSQMETGKKPAAVAAPADTIEVQGDKHQDEIYGELRDLGAGPLKDFPAVMKDDPQILDLSWKTINPTTGDVYVLVNKSVIDSVFRKLVVDAYDHKELVKQDLTMVINVGDHLHRLLHNLPDYNKPYNQAMNEYYNEVWLSYCKDWSPKEDANCPGDTARLEEIQKHHDNFNSLFHLYEKTFFSVQNHMKEEQKISDAIQAQNETKRPTSDKDQSDMD